MREQGEQKLVKQKPLSAQVYDVLNQMIMWIAVDFFHIFYAVAKIFATLMVTIYNFISRKMFLEA